LTIAGTPFVVGVGLR